MNDLIAHITGPAEAVDSEEGPMRCHAGRRSRPTERVAIIAPHPPIRAGADRDAGPELHLQKIKTARSCFLPPPMRAFAFSRLENRLTENKHVAPNPAAQGTCTWRFGCGARGTARALAPRPRSQARTKNRRLQATAARTAATQATCATPHCVVAPALFSISIAARTRSPLCSASAAAQRRKRHARMAPPRSSPHRPGGERRRRARRGRLV